MTDRFLSVTGTTAAAFDLDIPGLQPAWLFTASGPVYSTLSAARTVDGVSSSRIEMYPQLD